MSEENNAFKLIDAAPDHVGEPAQSGEAAEVVDPKDETIRELIEALGLIKNYPPEKYAVSSIKRIARAAILKATGGKDD